MIAARFATEGQGRPGKHAKSPITFTVSAAAELVNVGNKAVKDARTVLADAAPEVVQARNVEAETRACEIRLRAERRWRLTIRSAVAA